MEEELSALSGYQFQNPILESVSLDLVRHQFSLVGFSEEQTLRLVFTCRELIGECLGINYCEGMKAVTDQREAFAAVQS